GDSSDDGIWGIGDTNFGKDGFGLFAEGFGFYEAILGGEVAQANVVFNRHEGDEGEFLMDDGNALVGGVSAGFEFDWLVVELDSALVIGDDSAEDFDEGGFTRAVFSGEDMDF